MTTGLMYAVEGPIITGETSILLRIDNVVEHHATQHILNPIAGDACWAYGCSCAPPHLSLAGQSSSASTPNWTRLVVFPFTHTSSLLVLWVLGHSFRSLSPTPTKCKGETASRFISESRVGVKQYVNSSRSSVRKMCALSAYLPISIVLKLMPQILLLCPLFFTSWFYSSYIGMHEAQLR